MEAKFVKLDLLQEIRYITQRAEDRDSRIVTLGSLVLFSTSTGDAWLLDSEDNFALCRCRDGAAQSFRVLDSPNTFSIEWPASFVI